MIVYNLPFLYLAWGRRQQIVWCFVSTLQPGLGGSFTSYCRFTLSDYTPSISGLWPTPPLPCHCHESDRNSGQGFLMSSQFNLVSCLLDLVHKFPKVRNGKTKVLRSLFVQHYLLFLFLFCTGWGEVYDSKSALTAWENINYYHGFPADFWWRGERSVIKFKKMLIVVWGRTEDHKNVVGMREKFSWRAAGARNKQINKRHSWNIYFSYRLSS